MHPYEIPAAVKERVVNRMGRLTVNETIDASGPNPQMRRILANWSVNRRPDGKTIKIGRLLCVLLRLISLLGRPLQSQGLCAAHLRAYTLLDTAVFLPLLLL